MPYALHFDFNASNNEVEYETLITGLKLAKEVEVKSLKVHSDSQLIVNQVNREYVVKGERMT